MALLVLFPFVLAITLATPARYFGFYAAWLTMLATAVAALPSGSDHSSPFAGMSKPLYLVLIVILAVAIAVKGAIIERRQPPPAPDTPEATAEPHTLLWIATGALAACCSIATLSLAISAARPVWIPHAVAPVIVVGALVALTVARRRPFAWGFAASAVATSAALAVWVWSGVGALVAAAETIAGERPYCVQVAAIRPAFQAAARRLDFSPLTMRARCRDGWCFQNHAILAVGDGDDRRLMNWSHRRHEFRDEVLNMRSDPPAVICQPQPHSARELPLF